MLSQVFNPLNYHYTSYAMPVLVVAIALVLLGMYILFQNRKAFLNISFFSASISAAIWLSGVVVLYSTNNLELALSFYKYYTFLGVAFIAPGIYFLTVSSLKLKGKNKFILINFVVAFVFYLLNLITDWLSIGVKVYSWGNYVQFGPLSYPFLAFFFVLLLLSLHYYHVNLKKEVAIGRGEQTRLLFISLLIAYGGVVDFIPTFGIDIYPFGYIPVFLFVLIQFYSILKLRLTITMRETVDSMKDGVIVVDKNGTITDVSLSAKRILGISGIVGKELVEICPSMNSFLDKLEDDLSDTIGGDIPYNELNSQIGDGVLNITLSSIKGIYKNEPLGTLIILRDITERKKMENTLRESEMRYSTIVEESNDAIVIVKDFRIVFANKKAAELSGYTLEDVGMSALKFINPKKFRWAKENYFSQMAIKGDLPSTYETDIIHKDGHSIPVETSIARIEYKGGPAFVVFLRDITERKQAEEAIKAEQEKYQKVVESVGEGLFSLDTHGKLLYVNPEAEKITGYTSDELVGMPFINMLSRETLPFIAPKLQAVLKGKTVHGLEIEATRKDGTLIPIEITVTSRMKDGKVIEILGVARDITERKQSEAQKEALMKDLETYNEKLTRSNQDLRDFVHVASHDLREPLRKISSFGEILADSLKDKLDDDQQENFDFMIDGANRMQQMVNDLLTYSRVTSKAKPFEEVDLDEVIKDLKELELASQLEETNGVIEVPEPLPVVFADRTQMHQLLHNLIGNGLKYHKKGFTPKIIVSANLIDDAGVRVEVKDNGIGIEKEYQDSVFVMFRRLHSVREYEGSGIGLSVCKKIVERHGGEIGVESIPRDGSTFWFIIPSKRPQKDEKEVGICMQ